MTTIRLMNTRTRRIEEFVPLDPSNVRLYVCGPTVHDRAHLGNARPVVVFDVLVRLLQHVYGAEHVTYVRNFTDVDDKINAAALARQKEGDQRPLEVLIRERTEETIAWYHADMGDLGALRPTAEPRATEWIGAMIAMIGTLIERGHAYVAEGHVLFAVESYAAYGALSGRTVEDMIAGARVEVAPFKRNPMDFVLWKPSDAQTPGWESPWGRGRPGWHIECSAMSQALLGDTFDIHGGGIDLQFPHHENEIAQSACAHPGAGFARYWLHNEMLLVEGKKMSKSLGNFFTVRDLLDQGIPGEVIRFVLLGTHYRKPMDWTEAKRREAEGVLRRWRKLAKGAEEGGMVDEALVDMVADDMNTAGAIARLHEIARGIEANATRDCRVEKKRFLASARMLGLLTVELGGWYREEELLDWLEIGEQIRRPIEARIGEIVEMRKVRDFAQADRLRDLLLDAGVKIAFDRDGGVTYKRLPNFDPEKLKVL